MNEFSESEGHKLLSNKQYQSITLCTIILCLTCPAFLISLIFGLLWQTPGIIAGGIFGLTIGGIVIKIIQ